MEEITIKVSREDAERIVEALKYRAANVNEFYKSQFLETHYNVKQQIEKQE